MNSLKGPVFLISLVSLLPLSCGESDAGPPGGAGGSSGSGGSGQNSGGMTGSGGTSSGGSNTAGTNTGTGGSGGTGVPVGECGLGCSTPAAGACASAQVRITEVDVGGTVQNNESETELMPIVIAPAPSGGSRLAWMGNDDAVHIAQLGCDDQLVGTPFSLPAHDFQDVAADEDGGVVVLTRDAQGGGTLNCGTPANLCDGGPQPPIPCYDMFMVRFDCAGTPQWSTMLTTATAALPPYSTDGNGETVHMIWWYQHHGRIAYDGANYAAYFCDAISISEGGCINIHEGDRMQVVGPAGDLLSGHDSFAGGCSHSGFTRIVWDAAAGHFVMVCKTDNNNRIAMPAPYRTVYPVDLASSSLGDIVVSPGGGYWVTVSNLGSVHLLHFTDGEADQDITLAQADYPHLASYGAGHMVAAWESGSSLTAQVLDATTGAAVGATIPIDVPGNRYHAMRGFPDGSVAYAAPGTSNTKIRIARVLPCSG